MVNYLRLALVWVLLVSLMFLMLPQSYSQDQDIDQTKIDEAVNKGADYLLKPLKEDIRNRRLKKRRETELMVLTLLHTEIDPKDAVLRKAIQELTTKKLSQTYNVALTAMALEMAGPGKYQMRIAELTVFSLSPSPPIKGGAILGMEYQNPGMHF